MACNCDEGSEMGVGMDCVVFVEGAMTVGGGLTGGSGDMVAALDENAEVKTIAGIEVVDETDDEDTEEVGGVEIGGEVDSFVDDMTGDVDSKMTNRKMIHKTR
jgi:hypothetical protein